VKSERFCEGKALNEKANDPLLQFVLDLRQACDSFIEKATPVECREIPETVFSCLAYQAHVGEKLGAYETAQAKDNDQRAFDEALNILKEAKAAINSRYHGSNYVYSYWLYGQNLMVYRQKLKK
jgi:hypothetical protein